MSRPAKPFSIRLMLERELKSIDCRLKSLRDQRELVATELENVLAAESSEDVGHSFDFSSDEE